MKCRTWPPFYEKDINGQCVKVPPKQEKETFMDYVAFVSVFLFVGAIISIPMFSYDK